MSDMLHIERDAELEFAKTTTTTTQCIPTKWGSGEGKMYTVHTAISEKAKRLFPIDPRQLEFTKEELNFVPAPDVNSEGQKPFEFLVSHVQPDQELGDTIYNLTAVSTSIGLGGMHLVLFKLEGNHRLPSTNLLHGNMVCVRKCDSRGAVGWLDPLLLMDRWQLLETCTSLARYVHSCLWTFKGDLGSYLQKKGRLSPSKVLGFALDIASFGKILAAYFLSKTLVCCSGVDCDPSKLPNDSGTQPCQFQTVIAEFTVNGTSQPLEAKTASPKEVRRIFTMGLPFTGHYGGQILFGPSDGYLYFMMGDGGGSGDLYNFFKNKKSLLEKIMRLDVDSTPSAAEITKLGLWGDYTIPKDNPYIEDKELQLEIRALGMRNPWR
ncbi:HIPL1 protein [Capsicum chinense]|nr:HIPL1 protein [Capsicum chinense]